MTAEKLLELKNELERKASMILSEEELSEIDIKVNEFRENLLAEAKARHNEDPEQIRIKLQFIDELLALERIEEPQAPAQSPIEEKRDSEPEAQAPIDNILEAIEKSYEDCVSSEPKEEERAGVML